MKKSIKAALLSALVYPGTGHFFLKKYTSFALISLAFTVPLYFIFSEIMTKAQHIAEQIQKGEIPFNVSAILNAVHSSTLSADTQEINVKLYLLFIIWLIAMIDAYRLGVKALPEP